MQVAVPNTVTLSPEERASLERLLSSGCITRAPRLQAILKFLIDALINGQSSTLSEQSIGVQVFSLPEGYSSGDDNIVRVSIRHLRARLEEYYRTEGLNEQYILTIPKGKYVPVLITRPAPDTWPSENSQTQAIETEPSTPQTAIERRPRSLAWMLLVAVLLLGNAILGTFLYRSTHGQGPGLGMLQVLPQAGQSTLVVVTDTNLGNHITLFQKPVTLSSYIDRSYIGADATSFADPMLTRAVHFSTQTTDTSVTSAIVAALILKAEPTGTAFIRHPASISLRDFQHDNIILLGGPWVNPWGQLFEGKLNFQIEHGSKPGSDSEIDNLKPRSGEPSVFLPHREGELMVNYVRIALLPNLSGNGRVILVGATSPESLEAGGEFLVQRTSLQQMMHALGVSSPAQLPFFELVLQVEGLETVPENAKIIAERIVHY